MSTVAVIRRVFAFFILLLFAFAKSGYASYVNYDFEQTINSTSLGSVPQQESGFSYSDGRGNSISVSKTQHVPAIIYQYPYAVWVGASGENVPANAIVFEYVNGYPIYYCRVSRGNMMMYGRLYQDQGCVISDGRMRSFVSFEVLVR